VLRNVVLPRERARSSVTFILFRLMHIDYLRLARFVARYADLILSLSTPVKRGEAVRT